MSMKLIVSGRLKATFTACTIFTLPFQICCLKTELLLKCSNLVELHWSGPRLTKDVEGKFDFGAFFLISLPFSCVANNTVCFVC